MEIKQSEKISSLPLEKLWQVLPDTARTVLFDFLSRADIESLEEIRLRRGRSLEVKISGKTRTFPSCIVSADEIDRCFKAICGGSLYVHLDTLKQGYITLEGGIRVGIVGEVSREGESIIGLCSASSLCIRVPHSLRVDTDLICDLIRTGNSVLIYSRAGEGKTTLLRALASRLCDSRFDDALSVALIDTRDELAFGIEGTSKRIDVLSSYPKCAGIEIATRVMSPDVIVCDEIGSEETNGLLFCTNCGVRIAASAHAGNLFELLHRNGIKKLHESKVFSYYAGISRNCGGGFDYSIVSREEADAVFENGG